MNLKRDLALGAMAGLVTGAVAIGLVTGLARAANTDGDVKIDNFSFTPPQLTVKAGTTVTWANHDDIPHTVVSKTLVFKSRAMDTDDKFSFTFTTPGTFPYFCSLHPHMTGSIVVEATDK
jgi:plastocyanin